MILTQTLALLLDAYRELNHKKLFWITLILSGCFMCVFAIFGVSERGFTILGWNPGWGGSYASAATAYKTIFDWFGIGLWLTWAATILALISTAFIFPDFITAGSIELYLTKPIGRLRLFLTKYISGLLFVALQVTAFCVVAFLVMGIRAGLWMPSIFLGIPIVTLFFSYLYSIQTLFGVWTRSTIAALLITTVCWCGFRVAHWAESTLLEITVSMSASAREAPARIAELDARIARLEGAASATSEPASAPALPELERLRQWRRAIVSQQEGNDAALPVLQKLHTACYVIQTLMPKTTDTVELLSRCIIKTDEVTDSKTGFRSRGRSSEDTDLDPTNLTDMKQGVAAARDRPVWWVIGTSLIFEALVLTLAAWIFCRRDY